MCSSLFMPYVAQNCSESAICCTWTQCCPVRVWTSVWRIGIHVDLWTYMFLVVWFCNISWRHFLHVTSDNSTEVSQDDASELWYLVPAIWMAPDGVKVVSHVVSANDVRKQILMLDDSDDIDIVFFRYPVYWYPLTPVYCSITVICGINGMYDIYLYIL